MNYQIPDNEKGNPDYHAINAERAEARALRKAWIKAEDENQNLRKELEAAKADIERLTLAAK